MNLDNQISFILPFKLKEWCLSWFIYQDTLIMSSLCSYQALLRPCSFYLSFVVLIMKVNKFSNYEQTWRSHDITVTVGKFIMLMCSKFWELIKRSRCSSSYLSDIVYLWFYSQISTFFWAYNFTSNHQFHCKWPTTYPT